MEGQHKYLGPKCLEESRSRTFYRTIGSEIASVNCKNILTYKTPGIFLQFFILMYTSLIN